jgi:hypothetical protein
VAPSDRSAQPLPEGTEDVDQRSTVRPPFDPEQFARESDSRVAADARASRSDIPTAPPPPGLSQYAPRAVSGTVPIGAALGHESVPQLAVAREDLAWFDLSPRARLVLGHIDGCAPVSAICAAAGIELDEAVSLLHGLARDGVVTWRD